MQRAVADELGGDLECTCGRGRNLNIGDVRELDGARNGGSGAKQEDGECRERGTLDRRRCRGRFRRRCASLFTFPRGCGNP